MASSTSASLALPASLYSLAGLALSVEDQEQLEKAQEDLRMMRSKGIWGPQAGETKEGRYLWTDAFGSIELSSLYAATGDPAFLRDNEALVDDVMATLGPGKDRELMAISGRAEEEDEKAICSYAHYNSIFLHALHVLSKIHPDAEQARRYHQLAVRLAKEAHPKFLAKDGRGNVRGIWWKVYTGGAKGGGKPAGTPQPGKGLGGLDHFDLYSLYRQLSPEELRQEIADLEPLVMESAKSFSCCSCSQDLGLGMMMHAAHPFLEEPWAKSLLGKCVSSLDAMWVKSKAGGAGGGGGGGAEGGGEEGYFCRAPWERGLCVAFASAGAGIGVQTVLPLLKQPWPSRIGALRRYLGTHWKDDPEYAFAAITWVMMLCNRFPGLLIKSNLDAVSEAAERQRQESEGGRMAAAGKKTAESGTTGQPLQPAASAGAGQEA